MSTRDELRAINEGFADALAKQDVDRVVSYYTDDARMLFEGEPIIRGKAAIDAMWRETLAKAPGTMRFESGDIFDEGSLVVDVGRYKSRRGEGKYVVVYQRQSDGSLKIAVDAGLDDQPAQS
jgi:ketosteroid isomerase-like protein